MAQYQPWYKIKFKESRENLIKFLNIKKKILLLIPIQLLFTDGACKHNGSKTKNVRAGIGIHFSLKNRIQLKDIYLRLDIENPTNNKAELTAILVALQECEKK